MRRPKIQTNRNKVDMTDQTQVRVVTKRLKLSQDELTQMVSRIGNSIAALSKEVAQQRAAKAPADAVIASVTETTAELVVPSETPAS